MKAIGFIISVLLSWAALAEQSLNQPPAQNENDSEDTTVSPSPQPLLPAESIDAPSTIPTPLVITPQKQVINGKEDADEKEQPKRVRHHRKKRQRDRFLKQQEILPQPSAQVSNPVPPIPLQQPQPPMQPIPPNQAQSTLQQ